MIAIKKNGTLIRLNPGKCDRDLLCPHQQDDSGCGLWCPLCRETTMQSIEDDKLVNVPAITLYCGCKPVVYEVAYDQREIKP